MLDVAPTELLLVAVVAVVVIGPKDLPKAMRFAGYWVGRARGVARQFRQGFDDMVRESELAEMEKKWAEENARIMREFPTGDTPTAALPAPVAEVEDAPAELTVPPDMIDPAVVPDAIELPPAGPAEMFGALAKPAAPKRKASAKASALRKKPARPAA